MSRHLDPQPTFPQPLKPPYKPGVHLSWFRNYNLSEIEGRYSEWYEVSPADAIEALWNYVLDSPVVRVLNQATGEIFEGSLVNLLPRITDAIESDYEIKVQPK